MLICQMWQGNCFKLTNGKNKAKNDMIIVLKWLMILKSQKQINAHIK
jgi:hypothetical protein